MEQIHDIISKADGFAKRYSLLIKSQDREIAMSLYIQMYEFLMMSNQYTEAGNVALKAAKVLEIVDDDLETIEFYRKSALAYIKADNYDRAIEIYNTIISKYQSGIFFNPMAKYLENLADLYEQELRDDEAISTYLQSCEQYNAVGKPYNVIKILNKVARLYIDLGNIDLARDMYLKIVNTCKKYNVHTFLFYDYLCTLCLCEFNIYAKNNETKFDDILKNKIDVYSGFDNTEEYILLLKCIKAFKNRDENEFIKIVNEYNDINKMDSIQIGLLNEVNKLLSNKI